MSSTRCTLRRPLWGRAFTASAMRWTLALLAIGAGACGRAPDGDEGAAGRPTLAEGFAVGVLLPESKTARWEGFDRPLIERHVLAECPRCTVHYLNAQQDAARQQSQADALLSRGVEVLVLAAIDGRAAAAIVSTAKAQGVPVVAYDRFASGPVDYYVSFVDEVVGEEQGRALLAALEAGGDPRRGSIVMLNGAASDPNAAAYKRGAHRVLDGKVTIGFELDTPDWSPDKAQQGMEQALTKLGDEQVIGVYAANDGLASGAIAALKGRGVLPLPPVTGQDAELAAVQRIVAGDQYLTIYKPYHRTAATAARMALAAAQGLEYQPEPGLEVVTRESDSGDAVRSVLLPVVVVTRENVASTIVADGIFTPAQICMPALQQACEELGLGNP
jgi:D-xylose transport system substrate-binding protein